MRHCKIFKNQSIEWLLAFSVALLFFSGSVQAESELESPYFIKLKSFLNEDKTPYLELEVRNRTNQPLEDVEVVLELYTDEPQGSPQASEYHCQAGLSSEAENIADYMEDSGKGTTEFFIPQIKDYGHFAFALELDGTDLFKFATVQVVDKLGRSASRTYPEARYSTDKQLHEKFKRGELELVRLYPHDDESCLLSL